jgi:hypothetical protein
MQWRRIYILERRTLLSGDSANAELRLKGTEPVRPERANLGGGYFMQRSRKLLEVGKSISLTPGLRTKNRSAKGGGIGTAHGCFVGGDSHHASKRFPVH